MFSEWLKEHELKKCLKPLAEYRPCPKAADRSFWENLPRDIRAMALEHAEPYLGYGYPIVRASDFMNFYRKGDRSANSGQHFSRRQALRRLVIGECVEHKGRFMDDIIDGVWAICEESFWGVNAHNGVSADSEMLPNVQSRYIDLFAGETAALLAYTQYLLGDELDAVTPMILQRVRFEIRERIILPYLNRRDFWWMGYDRTRAVNNWTPWVTSNMLAVFLLMEPDGDLRARCVRKACFSLDRFLDAYKPDGACDEGAHYWTKAGLSLFDCLDELYAATGGAFDFFKEPLIGNIARYIAYCHIAGPYYVNYGDGAPILNELNYAQVYRFGRAVGDEQVMALAARCLRPYEEELNIPIMRLLPAIMVEEEARNCALKEKACRDAYLADNQVVFARDCDEEDGFFFSAKGGNNAESHNHNDVGSCIAYWKGVPLLIDLGVETYSRKTFSDRRYEIWTMQSGFHNLPDLNGTMQRPGRDARAEVVEYGAGEGSVRFALDIAAAYPAEAGVERYVRAYELDRPEKGRWTLVIDDEMRFAREKNEAVLNFMTWKEPVPQPDGSLLITLGDGAQAVMSCGDCEPVVEKYEFPDTRLRQAWTDGTVYRTRFVCACGRQGRVRVTLRPANV